ncbi:MAG: dockerin type I domain-containing protein [Candidatus Poribacteria bacterium]|nr:dockerin type I domain-containing protein [Candidatus Poribacteria bacterium]
MKATLTILIFLTLLFSLNTFAQDFPYISFGGHTEITSGVTFSWDGQRIASGSHDHTVQIWEVSTGNKLSTIRNANQAWRSGDSSYRHRFGKVYGVALSPDGEIIASGGHYHRSWSTSAPYNDLFSFNVWKVDTNEPLWSRRADTESTTAISFSPDGQTIASGGSDNTIDLWEPSTGDRLGTLVGHTDVIHSIAFSADGRLLVSGSEDGTVQLWDMSVGRHIYTFRGHTGSVNGAAISPDGQIIASGGSDNTIKLWDGNTHRHIHTLIGHTDSVNGVAISPDGQTVVSGSSDSTIKLWEVSTGRHLHTLTGHAQPVWNVAFSPTEQKFASAHEDGGVLLWELPATHVRIIPDSIVSPVVGKQFTFDLNIVAGEDVVEYEVSLAFDADALRYVSSANGDYLPAGAFFLPLVTSGNTVTLSATSFSGSSNGDGTLATVTFEVVDIKESFIDLLNVTLRDSNQVGLHSLVHSARIEAIAGDVNRDGFVNIQDVVLVARNFGQSVPAEGNPADVNGDGIVNVLDLVLVADAFGTGNAAPSAWNWNFVSVPTRAEVEQWLTEVRQANSTDPTSQRGIVFLEQLLAALTPKETMLLANYPNPFNPETWIPYQLAEPADVTLTIYDINGRVVRALDLGHQPIGIYEGKSRAAHWDGKNAVGEPVASGVYFYTLTAGEFTATRKLLIRK